MCPATPPILTRHIVISPVFVAPSSMFRSKNEHLHSEARRRWTQTDESFIVANWYDFEKDLLRHQRWSWGGKLNLATLRIFQDMYLHLQERVRFTEVKYDVAVEDILELEKEVQYRTKELEGISNPLDEYRDFPATQKTKSMTSTSAMEARDTRRDEQEVAQVRAQLQSAVPHEDGLEKALEGTRSAMGTYKFTANVGMKGISPGNASGSRHIRYLQDRVQNAEAKLELRIKEYNQLKSDTKSEEGQLHKRISDLESQVQESERSKAAEIARRDKVIGDFNVQNQRLEGTNRTAQADGIYTQKRISDLEFQLTITQKEKAIIVKEKSAVEQENLVLERGIAKLEDQAQVAQDERNQMTERYVRAQDNVRDLFDQCQGLKGNLRVMCRIRPRLGARDEQLEDLKIIIGSKTEHLQVIEMVKRRARNVEELDHFEMERVFEESDQNKQIFDEVGQLVGSAINGKNICIFAYGQTGSGKTHTMTYPWNEGIVSGSDDVDYGIIPRSVARISDFIKTNEGIWDISVTGKYVEVYAEKVYDLLKEDSRNAQDVTLKYRKVKGVDVYEAESTEVELTKQGDFRNQVKELLAVASGNRRTRATNGNIQSSRSHSVLTLKITAGRIDGKHKAKTEGLLNLIDLAGSEMPDPSDKASQKEGIDINKSLTVLRKVLGEMGDPKNRHISFKESSLTKLLKSSLGEGCQTLMFVMVSPLIKDREETRNTLNFAMTAQQAKLKPTPAATPTGTSSRRI